MKLDGVEKQSKDKHRVICRREKGIMTRKTFELKENMKEGKLDTVS